MTAVEGPHSSSSPVQTLVLRDLERRSLSRQIDRVIEQLQAGDFRSAEVKKLRGFGIYRARLDDKNRLLFKLGQHEGRRLLLILEVVHNHDYEKARFLNGGTFSESDFEAVDSAAVAQAPAESLRYVHPGASVLHVLDKPLSFDEAQNAVFGTPLPLIVVGSAGSGKTALTLEKLKTLAGQGLYLTRSSFLVENARGLYFANRYDNQGQEVEFLSLRELIETIEVPSGREAHWADFSRWFERVRGSFKLREPHKVYEEIMGVITGSAETSPYIEEDHYLSLGVKQSIFLGDERRAVYQLFRRWLEHMKERNLFNLNMVAWACQSKAKPRYDFLVIDEVQDITSVELKLALATLNDKRQFLLCGDANQIVHPNLFSWARLKSLFHDATAKDGSPLENIHILSANYRNTHAVTAIANRLLRIKQRRFGSVDRESNHLVVCASGDAGQVDLLADTSDLRKEVDEKTRRSTRYAVVVLRDEDKPAAKAAFQTPLVFSVHEAKGLEYENVILFGLISGASQEFRDCAAGVSTADLEGDLVYSRGRDKTDKALDAYKFYVNALYVAMTRAIKTLLIVESEVSHPLFELLSVAFSHTKLNLAKDESSHEDWQREARRLELQGKTEQADQIRRDVLGTQPVPWEVISAESFSEIKTRALTQGQNSKSAQQLLFEYAVTYDTPCLLPLLVNSGFRHAKKTESGLEFIERTHYKEYAQKRSATLMAHVHKHGIDFRNPINETPLMVAAKLGNVGLVDELLAMGADPSLADTAGRTPLRLALQSWHEKRLKKATVFSEIFKKLALGSIKLKVASRMIKVDPRTMEWFLFHLLLVDSRRHIAAAESSLVLPMFTAQRLSALLATFPDAVVPPHRKKHLYVSSMLSKNELFGPNPYNRSLFVRVGPGRYVLNPTLEVGVEEEWVGVGTVMGLPHLFEVLGDNGTFGAKGLQRLKSDIAARLASSFRPEE